jgi:hypothetical protein
MGGQMEIGIVLVRSKEDEECNKEYQLHLKQFYKDISIEGVKVTPNLYVMDSIDGGTLFTGKFLLSLADKSYTLIAAIFGAWLHSRYGRKIRIKVGDIEVEASNQEDLKIAIEHINHLKEAENNTTS